MKNLSVKKKKEIRDNNACDYKFEVKDKMLSFGLEVLLWHTK